MLTPKAPARAGSARKRSARSDCARPVTSARRSRGTFAGQGLHRRPPLLRPRQFSRSLASPLLPFGPTAVGARRRSSSDRYARRAATACPPLRSSGRRRKPGNVPTPGTSALASGPSRFALRTSRFISISFSCPPRCALDQVRHLGRHVSRGMRSGHGSMLRNDARMTPKGRRSRSRCRQASGIVGQPCTSFIACCTASEAGRVGDGRRGSPTATGRCSRGMVIAKSPAIAPPATRSRPPWLAGAAQCGGARRKTRPDLMPMV
jgi:hypothetical protein